MSVITRLIDYFPILLLVTLIISISGGIITVILYFMNKNSSTKGVRKSISLYSRSSMGILHSGSKSIQNYGDSYNFQGNDLDRPDITKLDINEIKACGKFTPAERAAEYRRRGKSPSGVIDGVYNDDYRGNDEYNDEYRDWDADA